MTRPQHAAPAAFHTRSMPHPQHGPDWHYNSMSWRYPMLAQGAHFAQYTNFLLMHDGLQHHLPKHSVDKPLQHANSNGNCVYVGKPSTKNSDIFNINILQLWSFQMSIVVRCCNVCTSACACSCMRAYVHAAVVHVRIRIALQSDVSVHAHVQVIDVCHLAMLVNEGLELGSQCLLCLAITHHLQLHRSVLVHPKLCPDPLSLCACMRVCVHVYVRGFTRMCVHACTCAWVRTSKHACVYCVRACVRAYVRACVRACRRACVRGCARLYAVARQCSCARACMCARVGMWLRGWLRACIRGCVRAFVRTSKRASSNPLQSKYRHESVNFSTSFSICAILSSSVASNVRVSERSLSISSSLFETIRLRLHDRSAHGCVHVTYIL